MGTSPAINESRRDVERVFRKYDRQLKGFIELRDLHRVNNSEAKENLDASTLEKMYHRAAGEPTKGITFEDFYQSMVHRMF